MMVRYLFATFHLIALAIGIAAVYARWRALQRVKSTTDLPAVFHADNWYGIAVLLWVGTGLVRAFAGIEKGTAYYAENPWFLWKMGLFGLVFLLELCPMILLVKWRRSLKRGGVIDLGQAPIMAWLSLLELPFLLIMVFLATAMARGL
jgi:putative membrane protein